MKINELMEALPGSPSKRELRRFQADQEKLIADNVDKGVRAWLYKIKELTAAGDLTSQSTTKDYVDAFINFAAGRARINPEHPILIAIKNEFQKDLDSTPGNNRANMRHLRKAIYNIVKGNVQGRFSTKTNKPAETPKPRIISGQTQTAGGVEYVWNGSEWRRGDTGVAATPAIAAALTSSVAGGTP